MVWRGAESPITEPPGALPHAQTFGYLLRLRGRHVASLLSGETGRHVFRGEPGVTPIPRTCLVQTTAAAWSAYAPPVGVEAVLTGGPDGRTVPGEGMPIRRIYHADRSTLDDKRLGRRTGWTPGRTAEVLPGLVAESAERAILEMLRR